VNPPESGRGFERFKIAPTQERSPVVEDGAASGSRNCAGARSRACERTQEARLDDRRARRVLDEKHAYRSFIMQAKQRCLILAA
jgi:hypothetical protein